jgi:hypothetical protein
MRALAQAIRSPGLFFLMSGNYIVAEKIMIYAGNSKKEKTQV